MCSTPDGKYVVFGYGNGLSAIDTETQEVRAVWEQENLLVTDMVSYQFDDNIYVICTIDDLGITDPLKGFSIPPPHVSFLKQLFFPLERPLSIFPL